MKASAQKNNTTQYDFQRNSFVKVSDAARLLGISSSSLRRLESEGKITSERLDNNYRAYRIGELNALRDELAQEKTKKHIESKTSYRTRMLQALAQAATHQNQTQSTLVTPTNGNVDLLKDTSNKPRTSKIHTLVKRLPTYATVTAMAVVVILGTANQKVTTKVKNVAAILGAQVSQITTKGAVNTNEKAAVLAAADRVTNYVFNINVPTYIRNNANVDGDLTVTGLSELNGGIQTPTLTFSGAASMANLQSIDTVTKTTLEESLDIGGDVTGTGLLNTKVSKLGGITVGTMTNTDSDIVMIQNGKLTTVAQAEITQLGTITEGEWQGTEIAPEYGGTGITAYNKGDLIYASADNTLTTLPISTAPGSFLVSSGSSPGWTSGTTALGQYSWLLTGNEGITPSSNFLGTTDAQALAIRTNNIERMRVTADGKIGIGTTAPNYSFDVSGIANFGTMYLAGTQVTATAAELNGLHNPGAGQILLGNASSAPAFTTLSGDATLAANGTLTLANTGVSSGIYGSSTQIPVITVDNKGRITSAANQTLTFTNGITNTLGTIGLGGEITENTRLYSGPTDIMYFDATTGRIGIGTTNPLFKVDVAGSVNMTNLAIAGTGVTATASEINLLSGRSGTLVDTNNVSTYAITGITAGLGLVGGGTNGTVSIDIGTGPGIALSNDSMTIDSETAGVTSTMSSNSGIEVVADGVRLLGGCGNKQILRWDNSRQVWECATVSDVGGMGGSGIEGQVAFFDGVNSITGSYSLYWDDNSYRLGIGTTAPGYSLDVNGILNTTNLYIGGSQVSATAQELSLLSGHTGTLIDTNNAATQLANWDQNASDDLTTTTLFQGDVSGSYNDLQIVTSAVGSDEIADYSVKAMDLLSSAPSNGQILSYNQTTGGFTWVDTGAGQVNSWTRIGNTLIPITTGDNIATIGNIGAGTTNPAYTLDVAGSANVTNLFIGGTRVLATATELNVLNGATISTAEINLLSGQTGTLINSNTIASYATTGVTAGTGLTGGGDHGYLSLNVIGGSGVVANADNIEIQLTSSGTTSTTSSNSGLELTTDGLRMLGGCGADQVLSWNSISSMWTCTDISVLAGSISGTGAAGQLTFWSNTNAITGTNNLAWNNTSNTLTVTGSANFTNLFIADTEVTATASEINSLHAPNPGQVLMGSASSAPAFTTIGGDATLAANGTLTLANSGVTANTYGSSTQIPVLTVDSKGRITSASTESISVQSPLLFSNGLTNNSGTVVLGGQLSQDTRIYDSSDREIVYFDNTNGRVGIANTAPSYTLDVTGSANATTLFINGAQVVTTATEINKLSGATISTSELNLLSGRSGILMDTTNISTYATTGITAGSGLTGGGTTGAVTINLGIGSGLALNEDLVAVSLSTTGTTSTSSSNSGLELTSNGLRMLGGCDADQVLSWDTTSSTWKCATVTGLGAGTGNVSGSGSLGQIAFWTGTNYITGTNSLFWDSGSGKLGIGTSAPSRSVSVSGDIEATTIYQSGNQVCDTSGNCVGSGIGGAIGGSGNAGYLAMFNDGYTIKNSVLYQNEFSVGIGTTAPEYKLDIAGSANATNLFISGSQVTASATELNTLDGITATTSELNITHGLTATTSELNKLSGATATTAEINKLSGATASTSEFNLLTGRSGTLLDNTNVVSYATTGVTAGNGLTDGGTTGVLTLNIGAGSGISVNANSIDIDANTTGTTSTTSSNSGLELTAGGVRLLGGCGTNEVLAWNSSLSVWECSTITGLGAGSVSGSGFAGQLTFWNDTNTINGSNSLFWENALGRLGIGTTAPKNTLDVVGNLAVGSYAGTNTAPSNGLIVSGYVGIGTTNPTQKLEISEGTNYALKIFNPDIGGGYWNITQTDNAFSTGGGKLIFVPDSTTSANATVVFTNSGSVGIGTTDPQYKLDVSGSANITTLFLAGTQIAASANELNLTHGRSGTLLDSVNIGTYATTSVTAGLGLTGGGAGGALTLNIGSGSGITVNADNIDIDTVTTGTTSTTSNNSGLELTANGVRLLGGCGANQVLGWNTATSTWKCSAVTDLGAGLGNVAGSGITGQLAFWNSSSNITGTNNLFWDTANNKLGIGTATPKNSLDIAGSVAIGAYAGTNTAPANGLIVSGYVGLGTTNPDAQLELGGGNILLANNTQYQMRNSSGTALNLATLNNSNNIYFGSTSGNNVYLSSGDSQRIYFRDNTTINMLIDGSTGNIGVGTTNPAQRFQVNNSTSNPVVITSGGLVGIGLTSPGYQLDVSGSANMTNLYIAGVRVTSSTSELNKLTGATLTTAELNKLSGVLTTTSEFNLLSGRTGILLDTNNVSSYATTGVTAGGGLSGGGTTGLLALNIGAGPGVTVNADDISIDASTLGATSTTSSNSGLEVSADGIRLLGGCATNQILYWNSTLSTWQCQTVTSIPNVVSGTGVAGQLAVWGSQSGVSGSNSLFWNGGSNRLGIGTSSPNYNLDVVGTMGLSTGSITTSVINTSSAVGFTFNTTNALTSSTAKLLSVQNNGSEKMYLDAEGNLYISGTIITGNGSSMLLTNKSGSTVVERSLVVLDSSNGSSFTTTTTPYSTDSFGVVIGVGIGTANDVDGDGVCDADDICTVAYGGEVEVNVKNATTTSKGEYLFTSDTAGSAVASAKQYDGLIGVITDTTNAASGYVKMIFKVQPQVTAVAAMDKTSKHDLYQLYANEYSQTSEGSDTTANLVSQGLAFDTLIDTTKTDSTNTTVSLDTNNKKAGLIGGQTMSSSTTDNYGSYYLGGSSVNKVYYYDRTQSGKEGQDSIPQVLVELGIDPNWYNGVTLTIGASSSPSGFSQAELITRNNPNLSTTYNGSLVKTTGTYTSESAARSIYLTITTPSTFNWNDYNGNSATGVSMTFGSDQALGSTGVSVNFTNTSYNIGDTFKVASWYVEPASTTRGTKQQFPERSYVVATNTSVDIVDADTQKLWMNFSQVGTNSLNYGAIGPTVETITATTVLNGNVYFTGTGSTSWVPYGAINFISDKITHTNDGISGWTKKDFKGAISQRNASLGVGDAYSSVSVINSNVNDVSAAVIPNQPTQEVTVSGWGYIQGNNTTTISESVNLPHKFNSTPSINISATGRSSSAPINLESCVTNEETATATIQNQTTTNFTTYLNRNNGATFSSSIYYCYTYTATGTVSPRQYVAVATGATGTDGGVSIINETDQSVANVMIGSQYSDIIWSNKVALTKNGTLYMTENNDTAAITGLQVYYTAAGLSSSDASWVVNRNGGYYVNGTQDTWTVNGPSILGSAGTNKITSLYVTQGTSTIDGKSNTIYIGTDTGTTVLQEKQSGGTQAAAGGDGSSEKFGSVKYYTKDYISEEMVGDIRGMWPMNGTTGASIANGATVSDASIKAYNGTVTNTNGTGMSYTSGVRGTGITFDGTDDFITSINASNVITNETTMGVWIKPTGTTTTAATSQAGGLIMGRDNGTTGVAAIVRNNTSGQDRIWALNYDGNLDSVGTTYNSNEWTFIVWVHSGGNLYLYKDGTLVGSTASGNTSDITGTFQIGGYASIGKFQGSIDEPFVTATALTANQIKHMYEVGYRALQSHSTSLGSGSADTNQQLGGTTNVIGDAEPDYNNQFMYVGTNDTTNGRVSKINLNSDTNVKTYDKTANTPAGGTLLTNNDTSSLAVGYNLEAVASATSGVKTMGIDNYATSTSGNFVGSTITTADTFTQAYLWAQYTKDSLDTSNTVQVWASNDGGSNYYQCNLTDTDTSQTPSEYEYFCQFNSAGNSLKTKFVMARGSTKTNTYVTKYGIAWIDSSAVAATANNSGLYTNSGTSVANGSYIDVAHNQNTSDLMINGWVYDTTTATWKTTDSYSNTYTQSLQNQFDDVSASYKIRTQTAATSVSLAQTNYIGNGADGALTITSGTYNININNNTGRSCSGSAPEQGDAPIYKVTAFGGDNLSATVTPSPATTCLAAGDEILIANLQGSGTAYTNVGNYETLRVASINGSTIYFVTGKTKYYGSNSTDDTGVGTSQHVVIQRVPNYTSVSIQNSAILTATPWSGTNYYGGILFFRATGAVEVATSATISMTGSGYSGGVGGATGTGSGAGGGEAYTGLRAGGVGGDYNTNRNGQAATAGGGGGGANNMGTLYAGGAGTANLGGAGGGAGNSYHTTSWWGGGGGGGGYGQNGDGSGNATGGTAGAGSGGAGSLNVSGSGGSAIAGVSGGGGAGGSYGDINLTKLMFGSGGGGGGGMYYTSGPYGGNGGAGGAGGGIVYIAANTITATGTIQANGSAGGAYTALTGGGGSGGGGGGAGGSIKLYANTLTLGTSKVTAAAGAGGAGGYSGGTGGVGRIATYYAAASSGTTSPVATTAVSGYNTYGVYHSAAIPTKNATALDKITWEGALNTYGKISMQTRTGNTTNPNDGTWEAWRPTTLTTNYITLQSMDTHTDWSGNATIAEGDVTRAAIANYEDDIESGSTNITKITSSSSGSYAEATISSSDLSSYDYVTAWVRASQIGTTIRVGFGESAGTEQTEDIAIDASATWQKVYWDLADIASTSRDGVTKLRITNLSNSSNTIYIDNIKAEKFLNDGKGGIITSTPNNYIQYRAILTTTNISYQPSLENVSLIYDSGYKVVQIDTNTVRLYNYSGATQNLRLDVIVGGTVTNAGTLSLAPSSADVDTQSGTNSLWINKTGSGGNLAKLQINGIDKFTLSSSGNAYFAGSVGIGTTNALNSLDVAGGLAVGSYAGTYSAPTNGLIVSGNVGIGTTSPAAMFDVAGTSWLRGSSANTGLYVSGSGFVGIGTTAPGARLDLGVNAVTNQFYVYNNGSTATFGMGATATNGLEVFTSTGTNKMSFGTYDQTTFTPQMVIKSGNVGIGTTNPLSKLSINGTGNAAYGFFSGGSIYTAIVGGTYGSTTIGVEGYGVYGLSGYGSSYDFYASGPGVDYGTTSSIRWKNNVETIPNALDKVLALNGVYYDWDNEHGGQHDMGMIAEDVGKVVPEIVSWDPNDPGYATGMDYGHLTPVLVNAIKELNTKVENQNRLLQELGLSDLIESTESTQTTESSSSATDVTTTILSTITNALADFKETLETLGMATIKDEEGNNILKVTTDLNVMGNATFADVTVSGDLIAGSMKFDTIDNSINVLGVSCYNPETNTTNTALCEEQTLYLQKNLAGNVDLFNGRVVIEPNGKLNVKVVSAEEYRVKNESETTKSIGNGVISSGLTSVIIESTLVKDTSKIFVTATTSTQGQMLIVSQKRTGVSFTVSVDDNASADIGFDWWIVNME